MADFNKPANGDAYTTHFSAIRDGRESVAKGFDGTTDSNIPTGAIGWDSTSSWWKRYTGAAWVALCALYEITVRRAITADSADSVAGADVTGTVASATNALNLGGTAAASFVQTTDGRLTNSRTCNNSFDSVGTARTNLVVAQIPIGTRMYFYQASAPTGWTAVSGLGDRVLAVGTYNSAAAGNTAGTWQQVGHTLTAAEMPSHTHSGTTASNGAHTHSLARSSLESGDYTGVRLYYDDSPATIANAVNSGGAHTHTFTTGSAGSGSAHNHGNTWRPAAIVGLIAQRSS